MHEDRRQGPATWASSTAVKIGSFAGTGTGRDSSACDSSRSRSSRVPETVLSCRIRVRSSSKIELTAAAATLRCDYRVGFGVRGPLPRPHRSRAGRVRARTPATASGFGPGIRRRVGCVEGLQPVLAQLLEISSVRDISSNFAESNRK